MCRPQLQPSWRDEVHRPTAIDGRGRYSLQLVNDAMAAWQVADGSRDRELLGRGPARAPPRPLHPRGGAGKGISPPGPVAAQVSEVYQSVKLRVRHGAGRGGYNKEARPHGGDLVCAAP